MKRKIAYITGTRADYGLMVSALNDIKNHPSLDLEIIVTGMHIMDIFGMTVNDIKKDGFQYKVIPAVYDTTDASAIHFMTAFLEKFGEEITRNRPDIILITGDRAEMLAGAIAASYMSIPIAHISGGDISSTIDEHVRHAITKLAHIHFANTVTSAERIKKMGEDSWRVYITGAPGLDDIVKGSFTDRENITKKYHLDLSRPIALLIQHPVTLEVNEAPKQIETTLQALTGMDIQTIVIYPNADSGGSAMIKKIQEFEHFSCIQSYKSISRSDLLGILNVASFMIGNSSSGIIEAASFRLPVINIGNRQNGRERGQNVIDVEPEREKIKNLISYVLNDSAFKARLKNVINPYGGGNAGKKMADILSALPIDKNLLQKQLNYKI